MIDEAALVAASHAIAHAIAARDTAALRRMLAPGFVYRTPGASAVAADAFLRSIEGIPGEIVSVEVESLTVDAAGDTALVTGIQKALVRLEGRAIEDVRPFVDYFVRHEGRWALRAAVDLGAGGDG